MDRQEIIRKTETFVKETLDVNKGARHLCLHL